MDTDIFDTSGAAEDQYEEELTAAEKVHTLNYRSSVLENRVDASDEDQTQKEDYETANEESIAESNHHHDDQGRRH